MKNIFVDALIDPAGLESLRSIPGVQVRVADPILTNEESIRPIEQIHDVHICLCAGLPKNLSDMRSLEFVQLTSSGYSQLFGLNLPAKGVRACNARGVFDTAIAEWNVAMLICLARNLRQMIRNQESHIWDRAAGYQTEIRGKTVGLWGYGGIARQTARLCQALGMKIQVLTRSGISPRPNVYRAPDTSNADHVFPDRIFTPEQRMEFLGTLDFLILCMPLTKETTGIVGEADLKALPMRAFLLNPARGPLVQEAALLRALREHWIAGAALDTHYQYPVRCDHPLWDFENVILTPHVSGSDESTYFRRRVWDLFVQNVQRHFSQQELLNELMPVQLLED